MSRESSHTGNSSAEKVPEEEIALVEAALYVAGHPLDLKTLGSVLGRRKEEKVLELARELAHRYESWNTPLEVVELSGHRFVLQLKSEYTERVKRLSFKPALTRGALKTLSYVAYHQPVLQKKVAEARGSHAYSHLKQLEEMNLITREKKGRTKLIRTTQMFADYLGLSQHVGAMKRQLKKIFKEKTADSTG